jgi:hypothetical protein
MAQEELEIEIGPTGKVTVRTIGVKGPRCVDLGEMVARIVGSIESSQLTSEYYETDVRSSNTIDVRQHR